MSKLSKEIEIPYNPRPIQKWLHDNLKRYNLLVAHRRFGKKICLDEDIPTPTGMKKMRDIKVGDAVFDRYGKACYVTTVFPISSEGKQYRVYFKDSTYVDCCEDHLWYVEPPYTFVSNHKMRRPWICGDVLPTSIMKDMVDDGWHLYIPISEPVEFRNRKPLPLDPYILGAWLGDGCSKQSLITNPIPQIQKYITDNFPSYVYKSPNPKTCDVIRMPGLIKYLHQLDIYDNKHIPDIYKYSSKEDRLRLIHGLMDTDGGVNGQANSACFFNSNERLLDDVREVLQSVGVKVSKHSSDRTNDKDRNRGIEYKLTFKPLWFNPFLNEHAKRDRFKPPTPASERRRIVRIEEIPSKEMRCVQVDSDDSLFLVSKAYIPTHNSVFGGGEIINKAFANPLPNPTYAFISPTFAMAKRIIWTYMKDFLRDIPGVKFSENDLTIRIPRGDRDTITIYLLSAETPDSIVGIYLDGVIIDEYSLMKGNLFDVVVRPTLSDRNGWVIFTGTVRGRNQFYHHYNKYKELMKKYPDKYLAVLFKASETGILPKEELEELQATMSKEAYAQEYECDWGAGDSQTYYGSYIEDLRKKNLITSVPYDPMYPVDLFLDLGMNDHTAIWFRQTVGREFRYIRFIQGSGMNVPTWVRKIRECGYQIGRVVLPHDAAAREYSTGKTRQEAFRESGLITEIQPRQSLQDGIEAVRNHLPKCVFDGENCGDGILCLESYRKKWDDRNNTFMNTPVHDQYSHGADGFRYASLDERPSVQDMQRRRTDLPTRVNDKYDIYKGY